MAGALGIGTRGPTTDLVDLVDKPADEEGDEALAERARGDPRAFAALYRRYVDRVYRYCYRRLGSREAAEDATAAVFAKALAALPAYREGSFRGWLFAIAHNAIASEFRSRAARPEAALDPARAEALPDPAPSPEEAALAAEARASVLGVLPRLPEAERRVLELRLAGLSGPEIARVLGRSHGSVRVAQYRAIARVRALLEEGAGSDVPKPAAPPGRGAEDPAPNRRSPSGTEDGWHRPGARRGPETSSEEGRRG